MIGFGIFKLYLTNGKIRLISGFVCFLYNTRGPCNDRSSIPRAVSSLSVCPPVINNFRCAPPHLFRYLIGRYLSPETSLCSRLSSKSAQSFYVTYLHSPRESLHPHCLQRYPCIVILPLRKKQIEISVNNASQLGNRVKSSALLLKPLKHVIIQPFILALRPVMWVS